MHLAAKEGNLRDLQAALDRRKFAIARDPISPNGATPLHMAVVFGKTNILKYLGGRSVYSVIYRINSNNLLVNE